MADHGSRQALRTAGMRVLGNVSAVSGRKKPLHATITTVEQLRKLEEETKRKLKKQSRQFSGHN